ncbi:hypothetical protein [Azoarcus sp. KH32C]|uniref:hypothetical protein n=1 Tax=Azoarcus sp. KH32C TaxID=748247 RepID=UPI0003499B28|nr:hypothetical protein [Azoarcus sp. KH32C]
MHAMKMAVGPDEAAVIALQLLRHSLGLGHRRLSVKRLEHAVDCGAEVSPDDFQRCLELALSVNDVRVHERVVQLGRRLEATQRGR